MSYDKVTEPAGALEGLNLGAPIGAGSTSSFPAHPASSYTTGGNTGSQGLTGSSGYTGTGSNNHSHRDNEGDSHRTAVGAAASNATDKYDTSSNGKYDTSARNTTSGDKGIGGGHGGPTAFESDASRVGTDRTGDHHHHHNNNNSSNSGLTGDRTGDRSGLKSDAKAALPPGHHDSSSRHELDEHFEKGQVHQSHLHPGRNVEVVSGATGAPKGVGAIAATGVPTGHHHHDNSSRDGKYEQDSSSRDGRYEQDSSSRNARHEQSNVGSGLGQHEGHHHHHESSSHTGRNLAAGAGATGVATAVVADVGARDHTSGYEGIVNDSVTGQTHFAPGQSTNTTGVSTGSRSTGLATGAGVGAGVGSGVGAGHTNKQSLSEKMTGSNDNDSGPISELKQELKEHQKSGSGYDTAEKHPESKGPHGLVWHNGKYVHQRELDGHGSTGVPLK